MKSRLNYEILEKRLEGVNDAQTRARVSFFVLLVATVSILVALWNAYLSWDRQWADSEFAPKEWGQTQVTSQTIKSWTEGQFVGIPILGIRVATSDIAFLGSASLIIFSFYCCMCARRENHEIGSLLIDANKTEDDNLKWQTYFGIRSQLVLNPTTDNDGVFQKLDEIPEKNKLLLSRNLIPFLLYLPAIAIFLILLSDLYFAFLYKSPWRSNQESAWTLLKPPYKFQLIFTDFIGFISNLIVFYFCYRTNNYFKGTKKIVEEFISILRKIERKKI